MRFTPRLQVPCSDWLCRLLLWGWLATGGSEVCGHVGPGKLTCDSSNGFQVSAQSPGLGSGGKQWGAGSKHAGPGMR